MNARVASALAAAALVLSGAASLPARAGVVHDPCKGWTVTTVATGLGSLENLLPTRSGVYLSATDRKAVLLLHANGTTSTVAAPVTAPGGLALLHGRIMFNTGNAAASSLTDARDGTVSYTRPGSHTPIVWARGLSMPNGLAFLPDGSAVVSRVLATARPTGLTRIARAGATPTPNWAPFRDSNGLALSADGRFLYTDQSFTTTSYVYRVPVADPRHPVLLTDLAGQPAGRPLGLDDLGLTSAGRLYVAANVAGQIVRVDTRTGAHCVVAQGLTNPSSVRQGAGGGFPDTSLFAVGFDGRVLRLTPPAGQRP